MPSWGVFGNRAFAVIIAASAVANIGVAMFDTASAWLMTSLNPDPMVVSAVQMATTLPMFLLTVPAGALSDIFDPRRLLIGAQLYVVAIAVTFAVVVSLHVVGEWGLLATTFLLCAGGALAAPAWLLITPLLVPKEELDNAIAINNTSFNVARAVGPALAGLAIASFDVDFPFWFYAAASIVIVAALIWWRAPRRQVESLPTERFLAAVSTGLRYTHNNPDMLATMVRAVAFFLFASAYWALLPLVARHQMHNGPMIYGILFGMIGLGSIVGSLLLDGLKARLGTEGSAALATLGTILALIGFAACREPVVAIAASFVAGASWIVMMTTLFVSAQVALPDWVLGRGLAVFLTVYFGAMTLGSAVWGEIANVEGLSHALYIAAAGALVAMALTRRWKLHTGAARDLTPSMHWRAPAFAHRLANDEGPILVTVEYHIDPKDRAAFVAALHDIGLERRRDGAYAWGAFEDAAIEGRFVETSLIQSFLELKYLRARVTNADRILEQKAFSYLLKPPEINFLVAPRRQRFQRRARTAAAPVVAPAPAE
jgi:MFS family permease